MSRRPKQTRQTKALVDACRAERLALDAFACRVFETGESVDIRPRRAVTLLEYAAECEARERFLIAYINSSIPARNPP